MSFLFINGIQLPLPDAYDLAYRDIEANSSGQTESGKYHRDVIRLGVVTIDVTMTLTKETHAKVSTLLNQPKVTCRFMDPKINDYRTSEMYMTDLKSSMIKNKQGDGLWQISFTLNEL